MPINLLPEQEKKEDKHKKRTPSQIELTLPEKKWKPEKFREGGVLEFFRSLTHRPKPIQVKEEMREVKKPGEVLMFTHEEKARPREVIFTKPRREEKPRLEKVKLPRRSFWELLFPKRAKKREEKKETIHYEAPKPKIFEERPKPTIIIERKPPPPPAPEPERVPEVAKEPSKPWAFILEKERALERTKELALQKKEVRALPKPAMPKIKKPSLFTKFFNWLKRLFVKRPKEVVKKPLPPPPAEEIIAKAKPLMPPSAAYKPFGAEVLEHEERKEVPPPPPPIPPRVAEQKEPLIPPKPPAAERPAAFLEKMISYTKPQTTILKPPGGFDVNLLPEEMIERVAPKNRLFVVIMAVVIALVLVIGAYVGFGIYESKIVSKIEKVNQEISNADAEILSFREFLKQSAALKQEIDVVKSVLDRHIYWTNFFTYLESYTNQDVYFTSLAADVGGKITLTAVARDYDSAARQLVTFQKARDFVKDVTISSMKSFSQPMIIEETGEEITASGVSFSVSLSILPEIFYRKM